LHYPDLTLDRGEAPASLATVASGRLHARLIKQAREAKESASRNET